MEKLKSILSKIWDKLKRPLAQVFLTHLGRIVLLGVPMFIIGGIMSPYGTIGEYLDYKRDFTFWDGMLYAAMGIFVVEFLIMMAWATKNTIGDFKAWLKRRKEK